MLELARLHTAKEQPPLSYKNEDQQVLLVDERNLKEWVESQQTFNKIIEPPATTTSASTIPDTAPTASVRKIRHHRNSFKKTRKYKQDSSQKQQHQPVAKDHPKELYDSGNPSPSKQDFIVPFTPPAILSSRTGLKRSNPHITTNHQDTSTSDLRLIRAHQRMFGLKGKNFYPLKLISKVNL